MESNLFKYVWQHSRGEQLVILVSVLLSFPFYFASLSLPKSIVNQGIQGKGFEGEGSTQPFMPLDLPGAEILSGEPIHLFDGFQMEQSGLLLALSFTFLLLVFINGGFKFLINTQKGRLGERMLRRLRYELADRVLRFPLPQLRKMKQAEVATMIKDEVEPLGGFIGDAFVTPIFLGGQAITATLFILVQSLWLGLVAVAIIGLQAFVIPKLRRRILVLGKQRQITARQLAGRVGELIDGAVEVHVHDTSNFERADIAARLGKIFGIRYEIFQRKFFVKFLNNFLSQMTPFLFYTVGGLLAISGRLDIGALVAVIAAYKDLPGPIKELIDWDQQRNDVQIKYEQVIEQFQPQEILPAEVQAIDNDPNGPLDGPLRVSSLALIDDANNKLVDGVNFEGDGKAHIAVVGDSASGKDHFGQLLAGLVRPTSGDVSFNGHKLAQLPEAVTGRRLSYVGADAYLFPTSVRDNLLYGLKHRPRNGVDGLLQNGMAEDEIAEAHRAGNPAFDINADWIDYESAGVHGPDEMTARLIELLGVVEIEGDVYRLGLFGTIDPDRHPDLAEGLLQARTALVQRLAANDMSDLVVRFDPETYNRNATLAENLLFGTPTKDDYRAANLAANPILLEVLEAEGLTPKVLDIGFNIAKTMVEIFADLPAGHPFFEQFSFIEADDLPEFKQLVARAEKAGVEKLSADERRRLMALPLNYSEARHRLGLIGEAEEPQFVAARRRFAERLAEEDPGAVEPYEPDEYNDAASLLDNILFGRLAYGRAQAEEVVGTAITEVLDQLGLRERVIEVGLDFNVGVGGKRLSPTQRQKLAIARALLKRPDVLILNEATAVMDAAAQARIQDKVLALRQGQGVIWTLPRAQAAESFDKVLVMRNGRLVETGAFAELNKPDTAFSALLHAG